MTQREDHVKTEMQGIYHIKTETETETGVMLPQTKEHLGLLKAKEARKYPSPAGFRGSMIVLTP